MLIHTYTPSPNQSDEDVNEFYKDMQIVMFQVKSHDILQ